MEVCFMNHGYLFRQGTTMRNELLIFWLRLSLLGYILMAGSVSIFPLLKTLKSLEVCMSWECKGIFKSHLPPLPCGVGDQLLHSLESVRGWPSVPKLWTLITAQM